MGLLKKVPWNTVLLGGLAFLAGIVIDPGGSPGVSVVQVVDTATIEAYQDSLEALRKPVDGIRDRVRGRTDVTPTRITRVDTVYREVPPDTVYEVVNLTGRTLSVGMLSRTADSLWTPEVRRHELPNNCDDGIAVHDGHVVCDKARLGHLYVGGGLGTDLWAGLFWEPYYRAPWGLSVGHDGQAFHAELRVGLQIF